MPAVKVANLSKPKSGSVSTNNVSSVSGDRPADETKVKSQPVAEETKVDVQPVEGSDVSITETPEDVPQVVPIQADIPEPDAPAATSFAPYDYSTFPNVSQPDGAPLEEVDSPTIDSDLYNVGKKAYLQNSAYAKQLNEYIMARSADAVRRVQEGRKAYEAIQARKRDPNKSFTQMLREGYDGYLFGNPGYDEYGNYDVRPFSSSKEAWTVGPMRALQSSLDPAGFNSFMNASLEREKHDSDRYNAFEHGIEMGNYPKLVPDPSAAYFDNENQFRREFNKYLAKTKYASDLNMREAFYKAMNDARKLEAQFANDVALKKFGSELDVYGDNVKDDRKRANLRNDARETKTGQNEANYEHFKKNVAPVLEEIYGLVLKGEDIIQTGNNLEELDKIAEKCVKLYSSISNDLSQDERYEVKEKISKLKKVDNVRVR